MERWTGNQPKQEGQNLTWEVPKEAGLQGLFGFGSGGDDVGAGL